MSAFFDSPIAGTVLGIICIIATLLAMGVGILLLARGLRFGDPDRNKPHCPRCYASMAVPAGSLPARCGNCNREVRREKSLRRPKRNARAIVGGLAFLLFGVLPVIGLLVSVLPERKKPIFETGSPAPWFIWGGFFLALGALLIIRGWRFSDAKRWSAHCRKCRYDLRGHKPTGDATTLPVTCPECGRTATRHRHLFKPKKRRLPIAAGIVLCLAGTGMVLTPEVESKGGWSFAAQATVFLIALPHIDDPTEWDLDDDLMSQYRHDMWGWMRRLTLRRVVAAAADGATETTRSAAIDMLRWIEPEEIPAGLRRKWSGALVRELQRGDPQSIERAIIAGQSAADDQLAPALFELLKSRDPTTAESAAYGLAMYGIVGPERAPLIREMLASSDDAVIARGIVLAQGLGDDIGILTDDLLPLIDHPTLGESAIDGLALLGEAAPVVVHEAIAEGLASSDVNAQRTSLDRLRIRSGPLESFLPAVIEIARDGGANLGYAMSVLERLPEEEATAIYLDLLNADAPAARHAAARALGSMHSDDEKVLAALDRLAGSDPDIGVRLAAERSAGWIRSLNQ